jgi:hypothetical protein
MGGVGSIRSRASAQLVLLVGGSLAMLANAAGVLFELGAGPVDDLVANWIFYGFAVGAVAVCAAQIATRRDERDVWIPAAIAMSAWVAGSLYYRASGLTGFAPWGIDLSLVSFGAAAAIALVALITASVRDH